MGARRRAPHVGHGKVARWHWEATARTGRHADLACLQLAALGCQTYRLPLSFYPSCRNMGLDGLWWGLVVINTMQARPPACACRTPEPTTSTSTSAFTPAHTQHAPNLHAPPAHSRTLPPLQGGIMLTMTALFDYQKQSDKAVAMLAQTATRLEVEGADGEEAGNPLLAPLLPGAGGELGEGLADGGLGVGASAKDRQPSRRGSRRSTDSAGIRERLRESVLLLLTEGSHVQPRRRAPAGSGQRRGRKAPVSSSVP